MIDRMELRRRRNGIARKMHDIEMRIERGEDVKPEEFSKFNQEYKKIALLKGQEIDAGYGNKRNFARQKTTAEADLTAIVYMMHKDLGKTDKEIRNATGVSEKSLKRMKRDNNLYPFLENGNKCLAETVAKEAAISQEIKDLAAKNGITKRTLMNRIYNSGLSHEEAATKPSGNGGRKKREGN